MLTANLRSKRGHINNAGRWTGCLPLTLVFTVENSAARRKRPTCLKRQYAAIRVAPYTIPSVSSRSAARHSGVFMNTASSKR